MARTPESSPSRMGMPDVLGGGPGVGGRGPRRVDPADRAQLAESPVSWRRVGSLFAPFRGRIAIVVALIVSSSLVSLGATAQSRS